MIEGRISSVNFIQRDTHTQTRYRTDQRYQNYSKGKKKEFEKNRPLLMSYDDRI